MRSETRRWWGAGAVLVAAGLLAGQLLTSGTARAAPGSPYGPGAAPGAEAMADPDGQRLYELGCASCHGTDGRGVDPARIAFDIPLPDFSDCAFASREPDADWIAVAHQGGPVRGFSETMPAFGEAFGDEELQAIMDYIRGFCDDPAWPRGELNLPRPLFTEKAYPEDEAVWTVDAALEDPGSVMNELLYERRFGARNQIEVKLPLGFRETAADAAGADGGWEAGIGDLAVGVKRALWHTREGGSIFSLGGEVKLPTGREEDGFGTGTVVMEPFAAFGQILPGDGFLHLQAGAEFPVDGDRGANEAFWRAALGRTWTRGRFGRAWSPMVEVLGAAELEDGGDVDWDLVPQVQVTLNTRQHVMFNLGVRVPLTRTGERGTQLLAYVLWDWFDGGFFQGW